jgi:branched-chain amino acid transport system substrate-binding protein
VHPLPASSCSPILQRPGDAPHVLIASDFPLQGDHVGAGAALTAAVRQVLHERGFRAGRHPVGFQACDDSVADPRLSGVGRCRANARMYAGNASVVGVIGPFQSYCAIASLPILNAARPPVPLVSPSNTYIGLTRGGPGARPGEPQRYAAGGERSYVRVVAADDVQGAAGAMLASRLGTRRAFVLRQAGEYGTGLAAGFSVAARRLGIDVVGSAGWNRPAAALRAVRAAHADTVFLSGTIEPASVKLIQRLRREVPAVRRLIAPDGFLLPFTIRALGSAADGMYVTGAGLPIQRLPARGRRFTRKLSRTVGGEPDFFAIYAAQATDVLLDAIARSDGTRDSIRRALFTTRVHDGLIGDFSITPTGDSTERSVSVYRIRAGRLRLADVLRPPPDLLCRRPPPPRPGPRRGAGGREMGARGRRQPGRRDGPLVRPHRRSPDHKGVA